MTRNHGFTILEVMISGGIMAIVTAAALASYVAQVQLTNGQQQAIAATDQAREALRIIGNDVRTAAPGMNAGLLTGGGSTTCPVGTIPYSTTTTMACLPPIFRSTSPASAYTTVNAGLALPDQCLGRAMNPGYQLSFPSGTEPTAAQFFCPDDLVVLAVDDSNTFFVSNLANSSLAQTTATFLFMPPPAAGADLVAQTSFDEQGTSALTSNPMVLISGANGPVLINLAAGAVGATTNVVNADGNGVEPYAWVGVTLGPTANDVFGSLGTGQPVAMPARLEQYSIMPVTWNTALPFNAATNPFVSADLVRTVVTPLAAAAGSPPTFFASGPPIVLAHGILDMQVEFGIDPLGTGQLRYVNSGGYQVAQSAPAPAAPPAAESPANHISPNCTGNYAVNNLFGGTCFPSNDIQFIRSVRLSLLVRGGNIISSRNVNGNGQAMQGAAGVSAPFYLQPAVQDLTGGNVEAQNWAWAFNAGNPWAGFPTTDGAEYREVGSEIFVRNLGLSNNF